MRGRKTTMLDLAEALNRRWEMDGKPVFARKNWRMWIRHLQPFFGNIPPEELSTADQEQYRVKRTREGASPATLYLEMQFLRRAYRVANEAEPPLVRHRPRWLMPKVNNARKVFIDMPLLDRIRVEAAKLGVPVRTAIEMAFQYGWRRSELCRIRVCDVDLDGGVLRLETSKNGEPREVPIPPVLRPYIEELVALRTDPEDKLLGFSPTHLYRHWCRVRDRAGAKGKRLHDFRRTSARTKIAAGVPQHVIMRMQGWKGEAMFRRYAITNQQDTVDALQKLAAWEAGRKATA